MILLSLLGTASGASQDYALCLGYSIAGTQPGLEATGVALNAPLRVGLQNGGCDQDEGLTLTLKDGVGEVLEEWSFDNAALEASLGVMTVQPATPFAALSAYTLEAALSNREAVVIPFTTGEQLTEPLAEDPAWTELGAQESCAGGSIAWASFTPAPDPASVMELRLEGEVVARALPGDDGMNAGIAADAEELCLELVQVDGLGGERSGGERCAEVEPIFCRGCSATPGLAALLPALAALFGLRRRPR